MIAAEKPGLRALSSSRGLLLLVVGAGLLVGLTSTAVLARASAERKVQSQTQLNKETCDDYKKADAELNQTYQTILREYGSDRVFIASLRKAQLAWIRYRDAHLESIYPGAPSQYGSVNPMCRCIQLTEMTKDRTKILNQWVSGIEEGDVCAGSVKTQ